MNQGEDACEGGYADPIPLARLPKSARRVHPRWKVEQILTTHVLDEILAPELPDDALACIAFTSSDLWAGNGWNFVFGQASLRGRVGIWSIYRNGNPRAGERTRRLCLLRTIKTGTHEIGQMLSMQHCITYECNMNGSNSREESDRAPLWLCPVCLRKLCYATGAEAADRYARLAAFCREQGLDDEAAFFERSRDALRRPVETRPAAAYNAAFR